MKRIAIIGGGISGLSAAFVLEGHRRAGAPLEYILFDASPRLGGVLVTERVDGCLVEAGPDSFLTEKPWASDLCREVGLGVDPRRPDVHGPDKNHANRAVAAVFDTHQTADGARVVSSSPKGRH